MFSQNIFNYYYYYIVQFDLYLKCCCKNSFEIVALKKIILYFNFNNIKSINNKKKQLICIFFSFLITNQLGKFISNKDLNNNANLVCYKTSLHKKKMFSFFFYLLTFLSSNLQILKSIKKNDNCFTFNLNNLLIFPEVSSNLYNFLLISNETLNITFITNSKSNRFLKLFLSAFIIV